MAGVMKPNVFSRVVEEAKELGIPNIETFTPASGFELRARVEDAKRRRFEDADIKDADEREQTVLVRICEWTEWLPGAPDPASGKVFVHNGVTHLVTTQAEKLIEVSVMNTGQKLDWTEEVECENCDGTGQAPEEQFSQPGQTAPITGGEPKACEVCEGGGFIDKLVHYGLYAMQATLAANVSPQLVNALMAAQNLAMEEERQRRAEQGRDKREDIVVVQRGKETPNRPRRKKRR